MKLLLDVYTSLIFRFSFALPVSFVYRNYSVRVKRKIFGEVRVGQVIVGGLRGLGRLRGMGLVRRVRQVGRVEQVGRVRQVGRVGQVGQTCVKGE